MNNIGLFIAGALALVVAYNVWGTAKVEEGRQQERARVSVEAGKKNAQAQAARKRVTADNADNVLAPYYRD